MEMDSPYDEWSKNIHAVITFLKPFFDDWRSYASLVSTLLGIGVLIMENQVLLRMRMGRWEILGYILWCIISSFLGPIFDIVVMLCLFAYCRHKSASMQITTESVAKALLPPPVASHYRVMGAVCATATVLTLCSNVLYMLRGWEEPLPFYDWSSNGIRWMTSQIWYAIGMIFLFHVVTRPAQSGVVLFGKFPMDLWSNKWNLCILYLPVRYLLLELCDFHRENKHILIPLEIVVDVVLYNGPFLVILLRLLYLAWKVAYDEAVLTGAIVESDNDINDFSLGSLFSRRGRSSSSSRDGYVGLAMEDLDDAELGQSQHSSEITASGTSSSVKSTKSEHNENGVTSSYKGSSNGSRSHSPTNKNYHHSSSLNTPPKPHSPKMSPRSSPRTSPRTSPKASSPLRNVIFSMDTSSEDEDDGNHYIGRELLQREARRLESRSLA